MRGISFRPSGVFVGMLVLCLPLLLHAQAREFADRGWAVLTESFEDTAAHLQALEYFERAITENSRYDDAYHGLASTYFRMGNYEEAAQANQEALALRKNYLPYLSLMVRILIHQNRFDEAEQLLAPLVLNNDTNTDLLLSQADLLYAKGIYKQARDRYQSILVIDPYNSSALLSLVYMSLYNTQDIAAEDFLARLLEVHGNSVLVLLLASQYYLQMDQLQQALFYAKRAYDRAPESEMVLTAVIQTYIELGDLNQAKGFISEMLSVYPNNVLAWYGKGKIEQLLGETDASLQSYSRSLQLDPFFEPALISREELLITERPEADYASIVQGYVNRATILQSNYQYTESELLLRRALRIDPYNISVRDRIGQLYELREDYPQYLNESTIKQTLGDRSQETADTIEGVRSFLSNSVAFRWGLDQFKTARDRIPVHIFYSATQSSRVPRELQLHAWLLEQILFSLEHVEPVYHEALSTSLFDSIQDIDDRDNALVLLLQGGTKGNTTQLQVDVMLGRSGVRLGTLRAITSGKYSIEQAVTQIYRDIGEIIPRIGTVLQISGKNILFTLGTVDGLAEGAVLDVYANKALELTPREPYLLSRSAPLGTVSVQSSDSLVSEGTFTPATATRSIDIGSMLVLQGSAVFPESRRSTDSLQDFLEFRILDNSLLIR